MKTLLPAAGRGMIVTMPAAAVFTALTMVLIVDKGSQNFALCEADFIFRVGILITCMVLAPVTMVVLPGLEQFRALAGDRLAIVAAMVGSYASALLLMWDSLVFPDPWMLAIPSLGAGLVAGLLYIAIRGGRLAASPA